MRLMVSAKPTKKIGWTRSGKRGSARKCRDEKHGDRVWSVNGTVTAKKPIKLHKASCGPKILIWRMEPGREPKHAHARKS